MSLHLNDVPCYLTGLILVKDDAPRQVTMQSCLALWSVSISGNASPYGGVEWKVCPIWTVRALPSSGLSQKSQFPRPKRVLSSLSFTFAELEELNLGRGEQVAPCAGAMGLIHGSS